MLAAIPCRANVAGQINTDKGSGVTLGDWKDKSWDELDKAGKPVELKDAARTRRPSLKSVSNRIVITTTKQE